MDSVLDLVLGVAVQFGIGSPRLKSVSDTYINEREHEAAVLAFTYYGEICGLTRFRRAFVHKARFTSITR
jgi:hypothetical protein